MCVRCVVKFSASAQIYIIHQKTARRNLSIKGDEACVTTLYVYAEWCGDEWKHGHPGISYFCNNWRAQQPTSYITAKQNLPSSPHTQPFIYPARSRTQKNVSRVLNFDDDVETRNIPTTYIQRKGYIAFFYVHKLVFLPMLS